MPASSISAVQTSGELLEPGDRFELRPAGDAGETNRLLLPLSFAPLVTAIDSVEDERGRPVEARLAPLEHSLIVPDLGRLLTTRWQAIWLEYAGSGRFRLLIEESSSLDPVRELTTDQGVRVVLDADDWLIVRGKGMRCARSADFELSLKAARLATHAGFDRLICLPMVREMELLEHQTRTAKTVLRRLRGRALLCDEVGLGKTIEAGLVLSELLMRGLVRSVLVLVPPSLIEQWQGEMLRKFSIELTSQDDPAFRERGPAAWNDVDRVIASIHTAKREPHRSAIIARKWDMVIVDEAHHFRNRATQLWRLASEIEKQFVLLLTATPVQNNLEELFNLVTLLEPGLLRTLKQFARQFVDRRDKLMPRNVDELHALLGEVMVRNRRSTAGLQFTRRWARTESVVSSAAECELYDLVTRFVRQHLRKDAGSGVLAALPEESAVGPPAPRRPAAGRGALSRMALVTLQMALGSSSNAAARTLENMAENAGLTDDIRGTLGTLAELASRVRDNAKLDRLLRLLAEFSDKMVIFTQFRATQELLTERLRQAGHDVAIFHGGLSRLAKEAAIAQFRGPARLLVCTESGSEGRNLQFAHAVCNFDLPWNPMKIEQRIGRLSRIGQTHDVYVFNLVAARTIEAAVLHLLEAKLSMFELVIGEIDMILGNLDNEQEFQDVVADLWAESADGDEFSRRMNELGDRLLAAKSAYFEQRGHDDRLFADRFTPEG
jgi:superfamily II DNA or RNA helicase